MLCDATNCYTSKFKLYTGKSDMPISAKGATYELVMDFIGIILDKVMYILWIIITARSSNTGISGVQVVGPQGTLHGNRGVLS